MILINTLDSIPIPLLVPIVFIWTFSWILYIVKACNTLPNTQSEPFYGTLKYIYNNSSLNKFGTLCVFLINLAIAPIYYIVIFFVSMCILIGNFIYWITHVGRVTERKGE